MFAIDTHVHADHVTALGALRETTECTSIMGVQSRAECVSRKVHDGELINVGGLELKVLYTPGHTDDSYSFVKSVRPLPRINSLQAWVVCALFAARVWHRTQEQGAKRSVNMANHNNPARSRPTVLGASRVAPARAKI